MIFLPVSGISQRLIYFAAIFFVSFVGMVRSASGQSTTWDSLLTNSHWYVQVENMLSYATTGGTFADPQEAADQTLWSLGTATNGTFTGSSEATLKIGPLTLESSPTMQGLVTDSGQIRIVFSQPDAPSIVGIGQMREISGIYYMQMQMITGADLLVTHWAYMTQYDPESFTPPDPEIDPVLISQEWAWTEGTDWNFQDDALFGTGGTGTFAITDYRNGYFWGSGTGPTGSVGESFTLLGSMTPEGNVLYNLYADGTLYSLTGMITGDASTGQMALRSYDGTTFGTAGTASVVPEPGTWVLLILTLPVALFFRGGRGKIG